MRWASRSRLLVSLHLGGAPLAPVEQHGEQGGEGDQEQAEQGRAGEEDARARPRRGQHLRLRNAISDEQGIIAQPAMADIAHHPVARARDERGAAGLPGDLGAEDRAVSRILPRGRDPPDPPRPHEPVEAGHHHHVLRIDLGVPVESGELLGQDVDRDHAGEGAVRMVEPAGQPDHVLIDQGGVDRPADVQPAVVARADMAAEGRMVGEVGPRQRPRDRGRDDIALRDRGW